ncbi:MAG: histidinol-phosphate transaminase [Arenimonas sp.]
MSDPLELLRPDLRGYAGYRSARSEARAGEIWLNANESSGANASDEDGLLRRYPEPQPGASGEALSALYGAEPSRLMIGRGSDEAIDLLVRAVGAAGRDAVLVARPSFGMYAACARLQGARLLEVDLRSDGNEFRVDLDAVRIAALDGGATLVFLASPGNPLGEPISPDEAVALANALAGRALVVIDEAYVEFAGSASVVGALGRAGNLAVLRTLSKAHALAAARVGCLLADARVIAALRRLQAPYPLPVPSARAALRCLAPASLARTRASVLATIEERERVRAALAGCAGVRRIHASRANFLLVEFADADDALSRLGAAGVVVRDLRAMPGLDTALRITIGTPAQNDRMLATLRATVAA